MKFDKEVLEHLLELGYVKRVDHPTIPICLYNYTCFGNHQLALYVKGEPEFLDEEDYNTLLRCRGVCFEVEELDNPEVQFVENLNAPFPKFFNHFEVPAETLRDCLHPRVTPKLDGSLVIRFVYKGQEVWHTRGNFESEQAKRAQIIHQNTCFVGGLPRSDANAESHLTYLYEVIYPENRVVTDYGDRVSCDLIGLMRNDSMADYCLLGERLRDHESGEVMIKADLSQLKPEDLDIPEFEGAVISFITEDGNINRIKFKKKEYFELQKTLLCFNRDTVIRTFAEKGFVPTYAHYENLPEEFKEDFERYSTQFFFAHQQLMLDVLSHFSRGARESWESEGKKGLAKRVKDRDEYAPVFKMFDLWSKTNDFNDFPRGEDGCWEPAFRESFNKCLLKRLGVK